MNEEEFFNLHKQQIGQLELEDDDNIEIISAEKCA